MSVNKHRPHVFVLPEDDADRQLAKGFQKDVDSNRYHQMQVLPEAGGWTEVLERFKSDHVIEMDRYPHRFMVLLIDFDDREDRLDIAKAAIPDRLSLCSRCLERSRTPSESPQESQTRLLRSHRFGACEGLPRRNRFNLGTSSPSTQCKRACSITRARSPDSVLVHSTTPSLRGPKCAD